MMQISMPRRLIHSCIIHSLSQLTQGPYPIVVWRLETVANTPRFIIHQLQKITNLGTRFRAEKRSAQASTHLLSQAQGGLFCVLTEFDCVCLSLREFWLRLNEMHEV